MTAPSAAKDARSFPNDQIATGAELYTVNCSPCHGARMEDPGAAFNLRKFPPDQRERFVNAVTRGKNQMPPWGDFLDRKSTRLNSSHQIISYAVFCLKKKNNALTT